MCGSGDTNCDCKSTLGVWVGVVPVPRILGMSGKMRPSTGKGWLFVDSSEQTSFASIERLDRPRKLGAVLNNGNQSSQRLREEPNILSKTSINGHFDCFTTTTLLMATSSIWVIVGSGAAAVQYKRVKAHTLALSAPWGAAHVFPPSCTPSRAYPEPIRLSALFPSDLNP